MEIYKILEQQIFKNGDYSIVPIRFVDREKILQWIDEQNVHPNFLPSLISDNNENSNYQIWQEYFEKNISNQLLFSYLNNGICIGFGGLVNISSDYKSAKILFSILTDIDKVKASEHLKCFLELLEKVAFHELNFEKISFDIETNNFQNHSIFGINQNITLENKYRLRPVLLDDMHIFFEWVNEKSARENSLNTNDIPWEDHSKWFQKKIKDSNSRIFVLEENHQPVAQVRFDRQEDNDTWLIDFSVDHHYRGKNLGYLVMKKGIEQMKNAQLIAQVKKSNTPSANTFKKLNFSNISDSDDNILTFKKCTQ